MINAIKTEKEVVDWKVELQLAKGWIFWNERLIKAIVDNDWDVLEEYIKEAEDDIAMWKKRRTKAFTELGYLHNIKDKETA